MSVSAFDNDRYLVRRQILRIFGQTLRIYDPAGSLALLVNMKGLRLREDIRVYTEEQRQNEVLTIKARSILDISAAYDVWDGQGEKIGVLQRRGLKSILRDEWVIMDAQEQERGRIREDSWLLATVRRFLTNLVPQKFHGEVGGQPVFLFRQQWNPFLFKMDLDFTPDTGRLLDRRLGLAAAVLLCTIEGRQR